MKIETNSHSHNVNAIHQPNSIATSSFPLDSMRQRDIVIINPYLGGQGDHFLANKIANIALNEDCRVSIVSINAEDTTQQQCRNLSRQNDESYHLSQLKDPIFIVAPVSLLPSEKLQENINQLCETHHFAKQKIMLIEEMDISPVEDKVDECYDKLKMAGFNKVTAHHLGIGFGIGYLATDQHQIREIKNRFEYELTNLIDSYNASLAKDHNYHLGYISSDAAIFGTQVFIANTLVETQHDNKDTHYIMVLRKLNDQVKEDIPSNLMKVLTKTKSENYDYPSLFSKVTLYFADPLQGHLEKAIEFTGTGQRHVTVVITQSLPKNIFDDFMQLAHSGIMSGDQSLSEFISLKGTIPYYDMQPWKQGVAKGLKNVWRESERASMADHKIIGLNRMGTPIYKFLPNKNQPELSPKQITRKAEVEEELYSMQANQYISQFITSDIKK
ncbi:hypothetical protein AB7W11_17080 [Providencia manganoxydans]|uniref:hypothetical protein n=1 Tax=Providencia manganoxydans TaxID=2923283 RepID=UPI0034E43198